MPSPCVEEAVVDLTSRVLTVMPFWKVEVPVVPPTKSKPDTLNCWLGEDVPMPM